MDATARQRAAPAYLATAVGCFLAMLALGLLARSWDAAQTWQRETFGAPVATVLVAHLALTLAVLAALRWRAHDVAANARQPARWLEIACTTLAVFGTLGGAAFPLVAALGWSITGLPAAGVLSIAYGAALPLMALVVRKVPRVEHAPHRGTVLGLALVLVLAAIAVAALHPVSPLAAKVVHLLVLVGLGEELFYRGLLQSLLDRWRPPTWTVLGTRLGWGWVVQAVLFGAAHALLAPDPGAAVGWALWTAVAGLGFGWLRARSGTVLAPALVHGITDAIGLALVPGLTG